jgi:hypothetical protein
MVLRLVKDEFQVDSLVFYGKAVQGERKNQFALEDTSLINWELHLGFPMLMEARHVSLQVVCYSPDGSVFDTDQMDAHLEVGTEKHWFSNAFGFDRPGLWDSGVYRVEFYVNDRKLGDGTFEVIRDRLFLDQVSVQSLLLYEGEFDREPEKEYRVYKNEFSRMETQYIYWEVALSYPELKGNRWVKFQYVFYNPDGSVLDSNVYGQELEAGTEFSEHSMGIGFEQPGDWETGQYRMEVLLDGRQIAEATFVILKDNMYLFPTLKVVSLQFFEGDRYSPLREDRLYGTTFASESARFINWEVELSYPTAQKRRSITFWYEFLTEDGMSLGKGEFDAFLEKGWNSSWIAQGKGDVEPGAWGKGKYRVEVVVDGREKVEGWFEVV